MRYPENKRLEDVPNEILLNLCEWIMVDDDELRSACLDFLFQFTSVADNVEILSRSVDVKALVRQLAKLLMLNAKEVSRMGSLRQTVENDDPQPTQVPRLGREMIEFLLNNYEEPVRSSHW